MEFLKNGGSRINETIRKSIAEGQTEIRINGNYEIEQTILLPSGVTLTLDNCYLKMADNTFCQMFRNAGAETAGVFDTDIHIRGEGNTVLDGCEKTVSIIQTHN